MGYHKQQNSIIMNDLDKIFSEGLDDFQEVAPSKAVKRRVFATLARGKYLKFIPLFLIPVFSLLGYYSIGLYSNEGKAELQAKKELVNSTQTIGNAEAQNIASNQVISNQNSVANSDLVNTPTSETSDPTANTNLMKSVLKPENTRKSEPEQSQNNLTEKSSTETMVTQKYDEPSMTTTTNERTTDQTIDMAFGNLKRFAIIGFGGFMMPEIGLTKPNISRKIKRYNKYMEMFVGANLPAKRLANSDPNSTVYVDFRNESEKERIGMEAGLNYRLQKGSWFATGGIRYTQISENENYKLPFYAVNTTKTQYSIVHFNPEIDTIGTMPDPNNQNYQIPVLGIVNNSDTTNYTETFTDTVVEMRDYNLVQKYQIISIPLTVGYEFKIGKFGLEVNGGLAYSRLIAHTSNIVNFSLNGIMDEETTTTTLVKHNMHGLAAVGATWWFSEDKSLFIKPEIRYDLRSMFGSETGISQKYFSYNILLGLRYEL